MGNGRLTVNLTGQQGLSTVFITSEPSGSCEAFYSNKSLQSGPACSVAPKIPEKHEPLKKKQKKKQSACAIHFSAFYVLFFNAMTQKV